MRLLIWRREAGGTHECLWNHHGGSHGNQCYHCFSEGYQPERQVKQNHRILALCGGFWSIRPAGRNAPESSHSSPFIIRILGIKSRMKDRWKSVLFYWKTRRRDCGSGYVHTITGTAANVHDLEEAPKLLRSDDEVAYGDSGYLGLPERPEILADENLSKIEFRINRRPSSLNVKTEYDGINWEKVIEHQKSAVRCKVEHPFLIVKRQFGYCKTAYRGIAKNMNRFHMLFGCANLLMCIRGGRTKEFCSVCLGWFQPWMPQRRAPGSGMGGFE